MDPQTRRVLDRISQLFVDDIPHIRAMNMTVEHIDDGGVTMVMPYSKDLIGDPETGRLHGGAVTTLVDSVAGLAVLAAMPKPKPKPGPEPVATLDTKQGRRIANVSVDAWQEDAQKLIATADCHFLLPGAGIHAPRPRERRAQSQTSRSQGA